MKGRELAKEHREPVQFPASPVHSTIWLTLQSWSVRVKFIPTRAFPAPQAGRYDGAACSSDAGEAIELEGWDSNVFPPICNTICRCKIAREKWGANIVVGHAIVIVIAFAKAADD